MKNLQNIHAVCPSFIHPSPGRLCNRAFLFVHVLGPRFRDIHNLTSFLCVCTLIDDKLSHNIVKGTVEPRAQEPKIRQFSLRLFIKFLLTLFLYFCFRRPEVYQSTTFYFDFRAK